MLPRLSNWLNLTVLTQALNALLARRPVNISQAKTQWNSWIHLLLAESKRSHVLLSLKPILLFLGIWPLNQTTILSSTVFKQQHKPKWEYKYFTCKFRSCDYSTTTKYLLLSWWATKRKRLSKLYSLILRYLLRLIPNFLGIFPVEKWSTKSELWVNLMFFTNNCSLDWHFLFCIALNCIVDKLL